MLPALHSRALLVCVRTAPFFLCHQIFDATPSDFFGICNFTSARVIINCPRLAMKAIALLTLLALCSSAKARIGETLDQCSYRYGSSIGHISRDQVRFNRGHIYITVHVRGNHSIREDFGPEAGGTLSDDQIAAILKDNAAGHSWEIVGESATKVNFIRRDG